MFSLSLIADKDLRPLRALWNGIKMTLKHYPRVIFSLFLVMVVNLIGIAVVAVLYWIFAHLATLLGLPMDIVDNTLLIIGVLSWIATLIWTMPMSFMMWGVLYRYLIDHEV